MSLLFPEMLPFVKYATPPVIGAFIGYLTNRVAIRMLFRPLKPWRFGGFRVPMTPGVIPSKRHELALNMGEVVGDHLLTSDEIGKGLQHETFQDHLYTLIQERVDSVLQRDFGTLSSIIPTKFVLYFDLGMRTATHQIKEHLHSFVQSPKFAEIVDNAIDDRLEYVLSSELGNLLSWDERDITYSFLEKNIDKMFQSEAMEQWVDDFVHQGIYRVLQEEKSLSDLLPDSVQKLLLATIEKQTPYFLQRLSVIVSEPGVRDRVVRGACLGVDKFIDSLGSMADMVRGFLRMETVEEKIRDYLIEKDADIVAWLQSEEVQQKVVKILRDRTQDFLAKPIVRLIEARDESLVEDFCTQCTAQSLLLIRRKEVSATLASMIKSNIENYIDSGSITVREIFAMLVGEQATDRAGFWVKSEIRELLKAKDSLKSLDSMVDTLAAALLEKKVGRLARFVPEGVREGVSRTLQKMASAMLATEVPGLVETLNIRKIVTEKINSLDLLRLEGLLLSIMEEQFKYINLFGALLGFLIGCVNLLFLYGI
ncbi:MAG: DUF445 domain-containing protein [Desulforhopalus sp.]